MRIKENKQFDCNRFFNEVIKIRGSVAHGGSWTVAVKDMSDKETRKAIYYILNNSRNIEYINRITGRGYKLMINKKRRKLC